MHWPAAWPTPTAAIPATLPDGEIVNKKIIQPLPREPLTQKARAAIRAYAVFKCGDLPLVYHLVTYSLEAERMPRQRLYTFLEKKGFYWDSDSATWNPPKPKSHKKPRPQGL